MNSKSSTLYYGIGAIVLIALIVIAFVVFGKSNSATQTLPQSDTAQTATANVQPEASAAATESAPAVQAAPDGSPLVGTWISATAGKGMEGSGTIVLPHSSTKITTSGDVTIVIQKVENGTASGTLSYSHLCTGAVITVTGKSPSTRAPECVSTEAKSIQLKVSGDSLSFTGQAETGADVTFTGTVANDTVSGTFTRTSSYGKISGTFSLVKAK